MATIDPLPTIRVLVERLRDAHPNFGYIHVTESREVEELKEGQLDRSKATLRSIWNDRPYIAAGGFDRETANSTVEKHGGLVAFGRKFISNVSAPLVHRLEAVILTTSRIARSPQTYRAQSCVHTVQPSHVLHPRECSRIRGLSIRWGCRSCEGIVVNCPDVKGLVLFLDYSAGNAMTIMFFA